MTIQEMKRRKKELGYTYARIAELSGVPLATVQKVFSGATSSPRYETLAALEQIFKEPDSLVLKESSAAYIKKRPGEYTLEDYYNMPEERRVELIDGTIYDMTSPTSAHQLIAGFLYAKLLDYVMSKGGECLPLISPIDVQLDCDNRTMVEPDIVVVCDTDKIINRCIYGAPDFVIEVLSKSSIKKDSVLKLQKYMNAGVREYWIIDPEHKRVVVYDFESEVFPTIYGFTSKVPVGIWGGELELDFNQVYDHIQFLYERE